jgi:hypothetical protein
MRESTDRELTADELENVLGGRHAAQGGKLFLQFTFKTVFTT